MTSKADQPKKRKRRWLAYSMKTFLLLLTGFAIWLGLLVHRVNNQKEAVQWEREHGGSVRYDFQYDEYDEFYLKKGAEPPGPDWLRELIGIDYFADVLRVDFVGVEVNDLTPLASLNQLQHLDIAATQVTDLEPLRELTELQTLWLIKTSVSDLGPLRELTQLRGLFLRNTRVSDLGPLRELTQMRSLGLSNTPVSDLEPLRNLTQLQELDLRETQVSDLNPLSQLTQLQNIILWGTPVSDLTPLVKMKNVVILLDKEQQVTVPEELKDRVRRFP